MLRGFMLPAREWQIEDTWHVAGLKGTGSHHVALRDTLVPAANSFDPVNGGPCQPGPLYQAVLQLIPLLHSAFAVGMAEGALDALVELANTGRQQQRAAVPMRASEIFQYELGRIEAELRAARACCQVQAGNHWHHALAGTLNNEALLAQGTQTAIWITATCVRVVDACFAAGGGSALYESSPLQRRMRDLHVAAQHVGVQQRHYVNSGKLLLDSPAAKSNIVGPPPGRISHQEVGRFHSFRCLTIRTARQKTNNVIRQNTDQKYHDETDVMNGPAKAQKVSACGRTSSSCDQAERCCVCRYQ
jgi:alkylation response protein AidB-like acyl-CoA dehydrogenase